MSKTDRTDAAVELVQDDEFVEEALARAVGDALRDHKRAGNPVPESQDGTIRWVAPEDIPDLEGSPGKA